jgi:hypothetical protein
MGNDGRVAERDTPKWDQSRLSEAHDLEERGFTMTRADDLLSYHYRCPWPGCIAARLFPDRLRVVPIIRGSDVLCPSCGNTVDRLGRRGPSCEVKLTIDGRELARIVLEADAPVALGRAGGEHVVPLDELCRHEALAAISRRHCEFWLRTHGHLDVRDLRSRNGTWVLPVEAPTGSDGTRLPHDEWYRVSDDQIVRIGPGVVLARSARRFVLAERSAISSLTIDPTSTVPAREQEPRPERPSAS